MKNLYIKFLLSLLVAMSCLIDGVKAERRVGIIAGLTGAGAEYAVSYQTGIGIAMKGVESNIKFIYEDDQFLPKNSVQAAKKLLMLDGVEAFIVGETAAAQAVIPTIPANIPVFVWAGENESLNRKNVIRFYPKQDKELQAVIAEIEKRDLRNIALLVSQHDYLLSWARGLRKAIPERISYYEEFPADLEDFRPTILKLKQKNISNVALALRSPLNGRFAAQQKELGLQFPMFGTAFLQWSSERLAARGALSGSWYVNLSIEPWFRDVYSKTTGSDDMQVAAAVFHDMAALLRNASANCSGPILNCLSEIKSIVGAVGKTEILAEGEGRYLDFSFEVKTVP